MTKANEVYSVEMTDTFAGEANYAWVRRIYVRASSIRGAIRKARVYWGAGGRIVRAWGDSENARYNEQGACICIFVTWTDSDDVPQGAEIV